MTKVSAGGNNPGTMTASTNSNKEQHLGEGDSIICVVGSEAVDSEIERRWKSKVAAGGNNPGAMTAATNSKKKKLHIFQVNKFWVCSMLPRRWGPYV